MVLRADSCLCTQGMGRGLREPSGMLGLELRSIVCQGSTLPTGPWFPPKNVDRSSLALQEWDPCEEGQTGNRAVGSTYCQVPRPACQPSANMSARLSTFMMASCTKLTCGCSICRRHRSGLPTCHPFYSAQAHPRMGHESLSGIPQISPLPGP